MNPFIPIIAIAAAGGLVGVGGAAFGIDQRSKRKAEQKRFRKEIKRLKRSIEIVEHEYSVLVPRVGKKNKQVRLLAAENKRLRAELWALRRAAA